MYKSARKLTLALTLIALTAPALHASTTTPKSFVTAAEGVTGGDPEPTSPNVIQMILAFFHLA